jgi:hypothetical protein
MPTLKDEFKQNLHYFHLKLVGFTFIAVRKSAQQSSFTVGRFPEIAVFRFVDEGVVQVFAVGVAIATRIPFRTV